MKTIMLAKKIAVGGLGIAIFAVVLIYAGLWGFEQYMNTSSQLYQLDSKVNGPTSAFAYQEGRIHNAYNDLQQQILTLKEDHQRLERFLFLPTDAQGRRILKTEDVGYYLGYMSMSDGGDWSWQTTWNDDPSPARGTSTLWIRGAYQLRIPYNPNWGNAAYTVTPYEVQEEDVLFGPVYTSEMTGPYRAARFSIEDPQGIEDVLADVKNQPIPCGIGEETIMPKVLTIGKHRVVEVVTDSCESRTITYILPGKAKNYIFTSQGEEEILKWVVERFEEK